ncbi:immunity protein YezG family protein [Streptococcus orisratti]|uniref:immunity protein YezG family protein n=1 Tax=Streptococcus orisratti TaxID=114652 RepID=UPI0003632967|nr:immunity protein YezG family protein [Streptococcus orisratti]
MFNELNALYKEVAQLVNDMIPDKWDKFVLNAEMDKTGSGTVYFFFKHQDKVSYSLEIPAEYRIDRKVFKKLNRELYDLVWKIKQIFLKENFGDWFSMILQVDENQEMRIDFDYTDWFNTEYGPSSRIDFVEYKYFDKKPSNDKEAKLLEEMEAFQAASK